MFSMCIHSEVCARTYFLFLAESCSVLWTVPSFGLPSLSGESMTAWWEPSPTPHAVCLGHVTTPPMALAGNLYNGDNKNSHVGLV